MIFNKHGIAKMPKESSRGLSLGLLTGFIGASIGLALGAGILGASLFDLTRVTDRTKNAQIGLSMATEVIEKVKIKQDEIQ